MIPSSTKVGCSWVVGRESRRSLPGRWRCRRAHCLVSCSAASRGRSAWAPGPGHQHRADQQIDTWAAIPSGRLARIQRVRRVHGDSRNRIRSRSTSRIVTSAPSPVAMRARSPRRCPHPGRRRVPAAPRERRRAARLCPHLLGQEVASHEHGHPAGDFAHRLKEGQPAVQLRRFRRRCTSRRSSGGTR